MKVTISLFLCFILLFFLVSGCESYNFDTVISGTLTTSDNKDSYGYHWKDFYFTPVAGMTYTVAITSSSTMLRSHVSEDGSNKATLSGTGTMIYRPTIASTVIITHVSVYAYPSDLPINYSVKISKKY